MNVNSPEKYLKSIETIANAVQTFEILDDEKIAWELISTGLRTVYGFQLNEITHKFIDTQKVETLTNEGLLIRSKTHIIPTENGLSLCDGISKFIFDI
jgi:coproporphyrinogen III oxidase-like Fe-S oxidoreductase